MIRDHAFVVLSEAQVKKIPDTQNSELRQYLATLDRWVSEERRLQLEQGSVPIGGYEAQWQRVYHELRARGAISACAPFLFSGPESTKPRNPYKVG